MSANSGVVSLLKRAVALLTERWLLRCCPAGEGGALVRARTVCRINDNPSARRVSMVTFDEACMVGALLTQQVKYTVPAPVPVEDGLEVLVPGSLGRTYIVHAGRLDEAARQAYTFGQCHAFAIMANRATGWPMVFLGRASCVYDEDCGPYPESWTWCGCQVEHVAVLAPDGRLFDIGGFRTVQDAVAALGDEDWSVGVLDENALGWMLRHRSWPKANLDVAATFVTAAQLTA